MIECFSLRVEKMESSKETLFVSFKMDHKRINGAALHKDLDFFLTRKGR